MAGGTHTTVKATFPVCFNGLLVTEQLSHSILHFGWDLEEPNQLMLHAEIWEEERDTRLASPKIHIKNNDPPVAKHSFSPPTVASCR